MQVTVYHPEPSKLHEIIKDLSDKLPPGATVTDTANADTDYLVAWAPSKQLFDDAPGIKACFSLGAGVDHLLRNDNLPQAMPLYRLEDAGMGDQMARYCRHETEHFRLLCWKFQNQQRSKQWIEHEPREPAQIRVGLLGYGVLGKQVAAMLTHDGYSVSAFRRSAADGTEGVTIYSGTAGLTEFLGRSDVLIVIAPLTPDTHGLINQRTLALLPRGAWVINVARGELINDDDLLAAINAGQIAGASLDVFSTEPLPVDHPFWSCPTIRITPHIAALTRAAESAEQIAGKIMRLSDGKLASGLVVRDRGY